MPGGPGVEGERGGAMFSPMARPMRCAFSGWDSDSSPVSRQACSAFPGLVNVCTATAAMSRRVADREGEVRGDKGPHILGVSDAAEHGVMDSPSSSS